MDLISSAVRPTDVGKGADPITTKEETAGKEYSSDYFHQKISRYITISAATDVAISCTLRYRVMSHIKTIAVHL